MITDSKPQTTSAFANPWIQLTLGILCMASVANLQYGWTLFVDPINAKYHWGRPDIQWAFTLFVFLETWLVPVEGYLVDRFGPRIVVIGGGILVAIAWSLNSIATSLPMLYLAAAVGGVARAPSTAPASATRSSGSRCAAGSPPESRRPASVSAPRLRSSRSRT